MDYIYFSFDEVSSSKYNLYIQNNGEDLSYPSQPGFENQIVSPLYQGTNYLAGVNKTSREFQFNCWADSLNRDSVRAMLEWLSPNKVGKLILSYNPNYYYNVKLQTLSDFKHMAINEDGTSNYEFTISFITIGDFAGVSQQEFLIDALANPLSGGSNFNAATFLNPDNLAPIGLWTANTVKVFNYGSEPIYPNLAITNIANISIKSANYVTNNSFTTYYNYSNVAATGTSWEIDFQKGITKINGNFAEATANIVTNTNSLYSPLGIPSGNPETLYTTINTTIIAPYAGKSIVLDYTDQILSFDGTEENLYIILQDGDYGYEMLTQTLTEEERALYVTKAINEQYNKINKDGTNSDIDILTFNTAMTYVVSTPGQIGWNQVEGTFDMHLLDSVKLQAGQELHFYGKIQGSFAEMDVMQFAGVQGNHLLFKKAVPAEIKANPQLLVGIATSGLLADNFSYITWFGKVNNVDTYAWVPGTILYFDPSTGGLTSTKPTAPNPKITMAAVIKKASSPSSGNGKIMVRPIFGFTLDDLDNVYINNPQDGQVLKYNASAGYWYNSN